MNVLYAIIKFSLATPNIALPHNINEYYLNSPPSAITNYPRLTISVNVKIPNLTPNLSIIIPNLVYELPPIIVRKMLGNAKTLYNKLN
jgi:hypothetical protein